MSLLLWISGFALAAWAAVLLAPWQPHRTRERLEADPAADSNLGDVAVLIPARNEAVAIERTLAALARQGRGLAVWVIDDQSTDGTAAVARRAADALAPQDVDVQVLDGAALPTGWAGKLWALEQGLARVERPYTLLLDADIELAPHLLAALRALARSRGMDLASLMATLRCATFWERLLAPPFVFFFKLLYPFALVNDPRRRAAGAAGGCMLVRTVALRELGGFAAIRGALIDDCTLAAALKRRGAPIWLGLSRSVRSLRGYGLADFWGMVSRSAFTQLKYSTPLLIGVTVSMAAMFLAPLAAIAAGTIAAVGGPASAEAGAATLLAGGGALLAMGLAYRPIVRFYALPAYWAATLPLAAALFVAMTWTSAVSYWRGRRATWKNRVYEASS